MSVSNVKNISYNQKELILTVVYGGGAVWKYHPVSMKIYCWLLSSEQLSKDIHTVIRKQNIVGVHK